MEHGCGLQQTAGIRCHFFQAEDTRPGKHTVKQGGAPQVMAKLVYKPHEKYS